MIEEDDFGNGVFKSKLIEFKSGLGTGKEANS